MACRGDTPVSGRGVRGGVPAAPRGPRSRYRHVQMEGVPPRTRYIRPMKLRPTLHDARVDRGGPVRALSSPAAHLPRRPTHPLCTPASEISLDLSPSNVLPCKPPAPPLRHEAQNPNPISRGWNKGKLAAPPCTGTHARTGTRARAGARARAVRELLVLQPAGA